MGLIEQAELAENRDFRIKVRQAVIAEARNKAKTSGAGTKKKKIKKRRDVAFMVLRGSGQNFIQQFWQIVAAAIEGDAAADDAAITSAVAGAWDEISMIVEGDDVDKDEDE